MEGIDFPGLLGLEPIPPNSTDDTDDNRFKTDFSLESFVDFHSSEKRFEIINTHAVDIDFVSPFRRVST